MDSADYIALARARAREFPTRVGLAAFIGLVAWVAAPSAWPAGWFGLVLLGQAVEWLALRPLRRASVADVGASARIAFCVLSAVNVIIYSGISIYLWFMGGEIGRVFAMVQVAGGLLHVSLHMHHVRAVLLSAAIPHSLYFLGLPLICAWIEGRPAVALVAVGGLLYMMHLVVAVRQSVLTTQALRRANALAQDERRKAEVASAAKSDFLAVVSHEIRTPMNAVISAANLLRRTRLDNRQREHVSMLMDAGDVLMGLLNDVLDFSKIEAGRMTLEAADLDLRDKLGTARRLWEPKATANGVRLVMRLDPDLPEGIRTDPLRFQQILFNLLSNAVKFTREGRIEVAARWDADQSRLIVSVADTGCGIPAGRLAGVFDSFEQVDAGVTRRHGGTGLGLAISRRLAQMMGGSLEAESVEGQGSTFTLTLPAEPIQRARPQPRRRETPAPVLAGRSVLAADDHEVNRRILALLLEPHGCRLTFVENGAEAVDAAGLHRFDAILMDMQMPVMDGLTATRRIREGGPSAGTPVIALTANAMDVHRAAWDQAGVHAFLTKPIDPGLLTRTLAEACAWTDTAQDDASAVARP